MEERAGAMGPAVTASKKSEGVVEVRVVAKPYVTVTLSPRMGGFNIALKAGVSTRVTTNS